MDGGPGGQLGRPAGYRDWGVITIWNLTSTRVTFSISASTYQNGRYYNFTLRPNTYQAYYATFDSFGNQPTFNMSFDPIHRTNSVMVTDINTVFQRNNWYPRFGFEGRPYAIAIDVSGYYLTPI